MSIKLGRRCRSYFITLSTVIVLLVHYNLTVPGSKMCTGYLFSK